MKKTQKSPTVIASEAKQSPPPLTLEDLNRQTQLISFGFYPNRTILPDPSLTPQDRIDRARELASLYQKLGEPIPNALLVII